LFREVEMLQLLGLQLVVLALLVQKKLALPLEELLPQYLHDEYVRRFLCPLHSPN
jgi:hypothetical protein